MVIGYTMYVYIERKYPLIMVQNFAKTLPVELFYMLFVYTLYIVGYGHINPKTAGGKLFCILYCIVGIPFTLVFLSAIVQRLLSPTFRNHFIINNNDNQVYICNWQRSRSPFLLCIGNCTILVQINLQHSQVQPYVICTRVIYLTQTHLYADHHTEKQLVPFLRS